jgi:hypothetical protein
MKQCLRTSLCIFILSAGAWAVDGIAVVVRNAQENYYGRMWNGDIYRIDVRNSEPEEETRLVEGNCSMEHLSPDGRNVGFLRNGYICVVSINGGTVTELCPTKQKCTMDFPHKDWIYFNKDYEYGDSSAYIFRVNINTKVVEHVVTFRCEGAPDQIARLGGQDIDVDQSLSKILAHPQNGGPVPQGSYVVYHMSAGDGMPYDGQFVASGYYPHNAYDIIRTDDMEVETFVQCPNDHQPVGSGMATNDADWICRARTDSRQSLYNWRTHEEVVVGNGGGGDFWVGDPAQNPAMILSPSSLAFSSRQGGSDPAAKFIQITNGGLGILNTVTTSIDYADGSGWLAIDRSGEGDEQTLSNTVSTGALNTGTYEATVTVSCSNADPSSATYPVTFTVTSPDIVLSSIEVTPAQYTSHTWEAVPFNAVARASDNSEIVPQPEFTWTVSDGQTINNAIGTFYSGPTAGGPYMVTATATVNGVSSSGTATVMVIRPLTLLSPHQNAVYGLGEGLSVTWTKLPEYTTAGLDVQFSNDNGKSWYTLVSQLIADGDPQYYQQNTGTFNWTIPASFTSETGQVVNCTSGGCRMRIVGPYDEVVTMDISSVFAIGTTGIRRDFATPFFNDMKPFAGIPVLIYDVKGSLRQRIPAPDTDRLKIKGNGYRIVVPDKEGAKHRARTVR